MIELKHITKVYGNFKALDDVSVTIRDGEIYGIVRCREIDPGPLHQYA